MTYNSKKKGFKSSFNTTGSIKKYTQSSFSHPSINRILYTAQYFHMISLPIVIYNFYLHTCILITFCINRFTVQNKTITTYYQHAFET